MNRSSRNLIIEKDEFETIKKIGEGGFAKVSIVEKDGKQYAMKEFKDVDSRQFLREIDILCRVDHPTIIRLFAYNTSGNNFNDIFIVTDYMKNGNLKDAVQETDQIKDNITRQMICIYGIAKGMEYCHKHNILHRDLKPENILLNDNFEPCITDFGLSKVTDVMLELCQSCVCGTASYMAPELIDRGVSDYKSDVYSYGLILYFIFSGKDPPDNFYEPDVMEPLIYKFPEDIQSIIRCSCDLDKENRQAFNVIVGLFSDPEICDFFPGIDKEVYLEYVDRINNYQSSNEIESLKVNNPSTLHMFFSIYIIITEKHLTIGNFFLDIVKKLPNDQFLVTPQKIDKDQNQNQNKYLLRSYKDINEKKLIPKILTYSKLRHSAILKLKGVAFSGDENSTFILKANATNGSLSEMIQNEKQSKAPPDWTFTRKIITIYGIAKAMAFLHSKDIIHHNLNPDNIFFDICFNPYVANFEMAIKTGDEDYYDFFEDSKENLMFIAPEIYEEVPANEKTDVYSFAIIMFYIFTQNLPFSNLLGIQKMKMIITGFRDIPKGVPEDFKSLINSCWTKKPEDRPTFQKIAEDIKNYAQKLDKIDINEFNLYCTTVEDQEEKYELENDYFDKNIELILEKALQDDVQRLIEIGRNIVKGSDQNKDIKKAALCFQTAGDIKGDPWGNYYLAKLYKKGYDDFPKSLSKAKANFLIAAESDDEELVEKAKAKLESLAELMGNQTDKESHSLNEPKKVIPEIKDDEEKGADNQGWEYYKQLADKGDPDAIHFCGTMLLKGECGIKKNEKEARKYFKKAADLGNHRSMFNYALSLKRGYKKVPPDYKEAAKYFKKAADLGNSAALFNYALMLKKGEGIQQNKAEAFNLFKQASDLGNLNATHNYATMLKEGDSVPVNLEEAAKLYKLAASKGNLLSLYCYAKMLENGEGVEADKKEAAQIYKSLADKNEPSAMFRYAKMRETGDGIEANIDEAIKYYELAASMKLQEAIEALKRLKK